MELQSKLSNPQCNSLINFLSGANLTEEFNGLTSEAQDFYKDLVLPPTLVNYEPPYVESFQDLLNLLPLDLKSDKLILLSNELAEKGHSQKVRKKSGKSYYNEHILPVAMLTTEFCLELDKHFNNFHSNKFLTREIVCGALLHDLVEDTKGTPSQLERILKDDGDKIIQIIDYLTKTSYEFYSGGSEKEQKANRDRYYTASLLTCGMPESLIIKLCDRICNLLSDLPYDADKKSQEYSLKSIKPFRQILGVLENLIGESPPLKRIEEVLCGIIGYKLGLGIAEKFKAKVIVEKPEEIFDIGRWNCIKRTSAAMNVVHAINNALTRLEAEEQNRLCNSLKKATVYLFSSKNSILNESKVIKSYYSDFTDSLIDKISSASPIELNQVLPELLVDYITYGDSEAVMRIEKWSSRIKKIIFTYFNSTKLKTNVLWNLDKLQNRNTNLISYDDLKKQLSKYESDKNTSFYELVEGLFKVNQHINVSLSTTFCLLNDKSNFLNSNTKNIKFKDILDVGDYYLCMKEEDKSILPVYSNILYARSMNPNPFALSRIREDGGSPESAYIEWLQLNTNVPATVYLDLRHQTYPEIRIFIQDERYVDKSIENLYDLPGVTVKYSKFAFHKSSGIKHYWLLKGAMIASISFISREASKFITQYEQEHSIYIKEDSLNLVRNYHLSKNRPKDNSSTPKESAEV
jgi:5'-deoxynucleotidase YfbR-like HD superfamily hydrolase